MRKQKIKRVIALVIAVAVISTLIAGLNLGQFTSSSKVSAADNEAPVLSTMSKYKETDYSFLKDFAFGRKNDFSKLSIFTFDSAESMKTSTDIRLKAGKYVVTEGYTKKGDFGGATYILSTTNEGRGSIEIANGLYANIVPDKMTDTEGTTWMVVNIKQFGAIGDAVHDDTAGLNDAFNYATNKRESNGCDRTILYIPAGEYKACNQLYSYEQYVNVVGDGDKSIIFTDNDYKADSSYSEPFMECQGSICAFYGHFKLEAREVDITKYMRQMMMYYCTDVYLYDITYYIPQEAWSGNYYQDKQYTNLTIYAGNHQITVDDCLMYQMSGTYRGANMGIMDFYCTGTEDITIMNCEFHDNARDEQFGIFSVSDKPASYVKNVDFINNTIYTYTTPYKNVHGHRTMCFTIAYGGNDVSDINISGNHFISEVDSKFMTFGTVKNCKITDNTFEIKASYGAGGALFDSSNGADENILIDNNEFYLSYTYDNAGYTKQLTTGHLTFTNNRFLTDISIWKLIEKTGIYKNNEFISLRQINNIGAPNTFENNIVDIYGGHSGNDNGIFGNWSGNMDSLSYCGNTINDYAYCGEGKNKRPFDRLFTIVGVNETNPFTAKEVYINSNTYNAPNYGYANVEDTMLICWLRNTYYIDKFECKGNRFQGATSAWFNTAEYDMSDNEMIPFNTIDYEKELVSSVNILKDGENVNEITVFGESVTLEAVTNIAEERDKEDNIILEKAVSDREVKWLTSVTKKAEVDNGVVIRKEYGDVTVYAAATDGSGKYDKVIIHFVKAAATDISLETDNLLMQPNHVHDIMYQVIPYHYASQALSWKTSNENVAAITNDGIVTSLEVGEADITCTTTDGTNISKTIHIKVSEPTVVRVDIDRTYDVLDSNAIGSTIQLNVTGYLPENAVNKGIGSCESTNENVAVVDKNGLVTIKGEGVCHIRIYSLDKSCYANYNLYVKPAAMTNLKVVPSKDKAIVTWDKIPEASGYNLYRKKDGDKEWTCISYRTPTKNTTFYDGYNGGLLDSDTTYYYYISAYVTGYDTGMRVDYEGVPSEVVTGKTNATEIPTAITSTVDNLSVVLNKSTNLYVNITPKNAEFESLNWVVEDSTLSHTKSVGKTSAEFAGDKLGFTKITVSEDVSGASVVVPLGVVPAYQVTELEAENDYNNISVNWKAIVEESDIDGYVITKGFTETYIPLEDLQKDTFNDGTLCYSYKDAGLTFGKSYSYNVTPYIEHDGYKYKCLKSNSVSCELPQYVAVTSITAEDEYILNQGETKKITVTAEPSEATRPEFIWQLKDKTIANIIDSAKTSADIKGIKTGVTQIEIIANDEDCYFVAPKIVVLPGNVVSLTSDNDGYKKTKISWNELSDITGYNIYRQDSAEGDWKLVKSTPNTIFEDTGVEYNTTYKYKVCGYLVNDEKIYEGAAAQTEITTLESPYGDLVSIGAVEDIVGIPHGTELSVENMKLPTSISIVTTNKKYTTAEITWNLEVLADGTAYDKTKVDEQTFTLTGVVIIPEQIDKKGINTSIKINVTVNAADKSSNPEFKLAGGSFDKAQKVSFNVMKDTSIYYTIDGLLPTINSLKYNEPFTLPGLAGETVTYTVKAIAIKDGYNPSDVVTETYIITLKEEETTTEETTIEKETTEEETTIEKDTIKLQESMTKKDTSSDKNDSMDKKPPKTGDDISMGITIFIMCIGMVMLVLTKVYGTIKNK